MELTDKELVARCLAGDQAALRNFVERFERLIFSVCLRMLQHREDAEDVVQNVLVRAIRGLGNWDGLRPLKPWLLTITVNCCRTNLSQRQRRPTAADFLHDIPGRAETRRDMGLGPLVQAALETLREEYRTCFILFHERELSITDVAHTMGCPEGTVKTWLHRARKELANYLRDHGVQEGDADDLP